MSNRGARIGSALASGAFRLSDILMQLQSRNDQNKRYDAATKLDAERYDAEQKRLSASDALAQEMRNITANKANAELQMSGWSPDRFVETQNFTPSNAASTLKAPDTGLGMAKGGEAIGLGERLMRLTKPETNLRPQTSQTFVQGGYDQSRDVELQRKLALEKAKPADAYNWVEVEHEGGIAMADPRNPGVYKPLSGLRPRPTQATQDPPRQIYTPPDGGPPMLVNTRSGETSPLMGPEGTQVGPKAPQLSPVAQQQIATNKSLIKAIDNAALALEKRPQSIGKKGALPDFILQRESLGIGDPGGVDVRAQLANIASEITLARSGGAVSDQEYERISPFLPKDTDTFEKAKSNLAFLKKYFSDKNSVLMAPIQRNPYR